ncbi:GNAT family N-acetyltransferase [Amycolatopsis sp. NPDC059657]|uniref:GNAT family N-acetyltransferase n=1 Tax=Amycolatopsis sp. NPDC059657 TaxID=3346899 RepID=UPI003671FF15
MSTEFEPARLDDVEELLALFRLQYGDSYPLPSGNDPEMMAAAIANPVPSWLVARDNGRIITTIMAEIAAEDRIARTQSLIVHPDARGRGMARKAVGALADLLLTSGHIDSAYGKSRTSSTAAQRMMLSNDFTALGIFPNAHKFDSQETVLLTVKHAEGVLDRREPVHKVPAELERLVTAVEHSVGMPVRPEFVPATEYPVTGSDVELELLDAPHFVARTFDAQVRDPYRRYYPLHTPNMLLTDAQGTFELYARLTKHDGYGTMIAGTPNGLAVVPHLGQIVRKLSEAGAAYLETIVPLCAFEELSALLAHGFLPAAMYPAMRRDGGLFQDYVVMARTMQPLDFRGLKIDEAFRPYAEQYIDLWTQRHLNTSGVFR